MIGELLLLCVLGSLLQLAQHEIGPLLIHRPVAVGALLGWLVDMPLAGFYLGLCLELIWLDRIPAGGIRTPAGGIGVVAGLATLLVIEHHEQATFVATQHLPLAFLVSMLYMALFVPLDGGMRRLWNTASENVVLALERGSLSELRVYAPVVLLFRWLAVTLGLLTAAGLTALFGDWIYDAAGPLGAIAWPWMIAAGFFAFCLRRQESLESFAALILFVAGFWWTQG